MAGRCPPRQTPLRPEGRARAATDDDRSAPRGQLEPKGDSGLSAIEDLSGQLQGLVRAFGSSDLTTAEGRAAVEAELAGLQRTKDKAQLEALVANTHQGLGDLMSEIDAAPFAEEARADDAPGGS